jgi:hypothetical protein
VILDADGISAGRHTQALRFFLAAEVAYGLATEVAEDAEGKLTKLLSLFIFPYLSSASSATSVAKKAVLPSADIDFSPGEI